MLISGSPQFCTGSQTYTISNLPTGATVSWSVNGTLNISGSNTSNPVTITKSANGTGTLTANISSSCGSVTVSKEIQTPFVVYPIQHAQGTFQICANSINNDFFVQESPGASNYTWSVSPVPGSYNITGNGTKNISLGINNPGNYILNLAVTTDCGIAYNQVAISVLSQNDPNCGGGFGGSFAFSPNPTSNTLTISYNNSQQSIQTSKKVKKDFSAKLLDKEGKTLLSDNQ